MVYLCVHKILQQNNSENKIQHSVIQQLNTTGIILFVLVSLKMNGSKMKLPAMSEAHKSDL